MGVCVCVCVFVCALKSRGLRVRDCVARGEVGEVQGVGVGVCGVGVCACAWCA